MARRIRRTEAVVLSQGEKAGWQGTGGCKGMGGKLLKRISS